MSDARGMRHELAPTWRCIPFDSLSPAELQAIHRARQRVFAVEQSCAFLDADELDEVAHHLIAWPQGSCDPIAYARLLPPGTKYAEASIGRVLTTPEVRGRGLGRELTGRALDLVAALWPRCGVRISAQSRLVPFYGSFAFVAVGPSYVEDGIDHTEMLRAAGAVAPASDSA